MQRTRVRRAILALLGCALLLAGVGSSVSANSTTIAAGFTISADQTSVELVLGAQAVVAVDVSPVGSWVGPVSLTVAGAPAGAIVTILPDRVLPGIPAVILIAAGASTPVGSFVLVITATSGVVRHSVSVFLAVSLPTGFTMKLDPPSITVVDGSAVDYALTLHRGLLTGPVALKVSGVPQHATATITPSLSLLGNTATVHVATTTAVVPGVYRITVTGSALLAAASASAYLIVTPQVFPPFPIAGNLERQLYPGTAGLLNLALTNPFSSPMTVTGLGVGLAGTNRPGCATSNFSVTQYGGTLPLTVPANSTRTLQQLGVSSGSWPKVGMLDLPTNQDGCKLTDLTLSYTGSGQGS
jgi:hypothetical protein